jgi:hypothetical protein
MGRHTFAHVQQGLVLVGMASREANCDQHNSQVDDHAAPGATGDRAWARPAYQQHELTQRRCAGEGSESEYHERPETAEARQDAPDKHNGGARCRPEKTLPEQLT